MSYMSQAILVVFILTCAMMAEAFRAGLKGERGLFRSLIHSLLTGSGFVFYAAIDYMLIVPGANYLMA